MSPRKIPFKVSARTARLIGRENIATSKGAIIELVKNGYDADGNISLVYFDNEFSLLHDEITSTYYDSLLKKINQHYADLLIETSDNEKIITINEEKKKIIDLLSEKYEQESDDVYILKAEEEETNKELKRLLSKLATLYIIDNGEGMTAKIINNHWMVIGTDNKHENFVTKSGRIKAGAKGIGRFALDKLGSTCEMITVYNSKNHTDIESEEGDGYIWKVNWEDFEGGFKTIDNVNAELLPLIDVELKEYIETILPVEFKSIIQNDIDFKHGTILKINNLRDEWNDYYVDQVYSDLEILVPPEETGEFQIYLFSSLFPDKYGEIPSVICDDFDYKLIAEADDEQNVVITVIRNEYDVDKIPKDFFRREKMQKYPYTPEVFRKGEWILKTSFAELMPGYKEIDKDTIFNAIGKFNFSFYYLKRTKSPEAEKFFHKDNLFNFRKDWLNKFGGIKIFRDNFRVRPYGEAKDVAFDWLGLGVRKVKSPAGISKKGGGYRVEPENVSGAIKISRIENIDFEDKSSREGLQENKTFAIFKQLIISIINVFEEDRSYIAQEMAAYDMERNYEKRTREEAENLARRVYEESRKSESKPSEGFKEQSQEKHERDILAELNIQQKDEFERLLEEMQLLRGMASSGIVLASFTHDLGNINNVLGSRVDKIKRLFGEKIGEEAYKEIEERKNPYYWLEQMKVQDTKIQSWLKFSLGAARKDKRTRKNIHLTNYFKNLNDNWDTIFFERQIKSILEIDDEISFRVFEIDLDSVFNNLIANSIEAFIRSKSDKDRQINIIAQQDERTIDIFYSDNGPGISEDITNPDKIFEPLFTTRRNPNSGEEIGTGLGMWIIKSIIEENDGKVSLLHPEEGFSIKLSFPRKYIRRS